MKIFWRLVISGSVLLFSACSMGLHVKNVLNAPIEIQSLSELDSMKVLPDVAVYKGAGESAYHIFTEDIKLRGVHEKRSIWRGDGQGSFRVSNGATVQISDFNFSDGGGSDTLITVENGSLLLENCDIFDLPGSAIVVFPGSTLEIRNVKIERIKGVGILAAGADVRILDSAFDLCGPAAIQIDSANIFEAHRTIISSSMGKGIVLTGGEEVWLDSVHVRDSFEDGLYISDSDFVLLENSRSSENGRHGLSLSGSKLVGLKGFSAIGNLVNGVSGADIDSLRLTDSEFIANGETGAAFGKVSQTRITNLIVGHNGVTGLKIQSGDYLEVLHSSFQANLEVALILQDLERSIISTVLFSNNGDGLSVGGFNDLQVKESVFKANTGRAVTLMSGKLFDLSSTTFLENKLGLKGKDLDLVTLTANLFKGQEQAADLRAIGQVRSKSNHWSLNHSGLFLSDLELYKGLTETWFGQEEISLEAMTVNDLLLEESSFQNNRRAILMNEVSSGLTGCQIDSSAGYGLKALNSSLNVSDSRFDNNVTAIELGEGSHGKITQSRFSSNLLAVLVGPSTNLSLNFSNIYGGASGILLDDFSEAQIVSNQIRDLDDYVLEMPGPNLRSLYLRQNVIAGNGGVIRSKNRSGKIEIVNNTIVRNAGLFQVEQGLIEALDHNIIGQSGALDLASVKDMSSIRWNCFDLDAEDPDPKLLDGTNIFGDPLLDDSLHLLANSPCLNGGRNGVLVGALGVSPPSRPKLSP